MSDKLLVRRYKSTAHLAESEHLTLCGRKITGGMGGGWYWTTDYSATLEEFVKDVHPACSKCKKQAKTVIATRKVAARVRRIHKDTDDLKAVMK